VLQALLGHENLNTTEVYLSLTDRELYAAAKGLDERNSTVTTEHEQKKPESGKQSVHAVPGDSTSGSHDPWTEALRVALDPANMCQALKPENVEEVSLAQFSPIDKDAADYLRRLLQNDIRRAKY
jgi:hypothetical protein